MIFASSLVWLCTALLFLAPAVNLMWRGGTGYCFFAILALALGAAVVNRRMPGYFSALRTYRWFTIGMVALVVATGVQQLIFGYWLPRQFDALSRFVFALPVFLLLRQLPSRNLRMIGWGCAVGALHKLDAFCQAGLAGCDDDWIKIAPPGFYEPGLIHFRRPACDAGRHSRRLADFLRAQVVAIGVAGAFAR